MARNITLTRDNPQATIDGHPAYRLTIHDARSGKRIARVLEVMLPAGKIEYRTLVNQRIGPTVDAVIRAVDCR